MSVQISLDKSEHVGGQNKEECGVEALGCSESQLSRDTMISHQALGLMKSETYFMSVPGPALGTSGSGPHRLQPASTVLFYLSLLWISILHL